MTWIVGGVTPFGQAFVVGDTRVTFGNGVEMDLVKKVHWVGRDLAAGFAGSVKIGFHLLAHLSMSLRQADGTLVWKPEPTMKEWSLHAARIFAAHERTEQDARCSVLVAGVAPDNNGPFARTALIKLSSPKFKPRVLGQLGVSPVGRGIFQRPSIRYKLERLGKWYRVSARQFP